MGDQEPGSRSSCPAWDHSACEGTPYCPPRCPRFVDGEGVPLLVRPPDPGDFESLVEMYEDLDGESRSLGLPPLRRTDLEAWLADLTSGGWNLLAVHRDRVVGHAGVAPATAAVPEFVVFVHQEFQDRGVGTELLRQLVAYAHDRDHDAVQLDVSKNNRRAIAVYNDVGFDVVDRAATELRMELSLRGPLVERVQRPPARRE